MRKIQFCFICVFNKMYKPIMIILAVVIAFLVTAAIFMATWNFTMPRLVESVSPTYNRKNFRSISYPTSMVAIIFVGLVFGSSTIIYNNYVSK